MLLSASQAAPCRHEHSNTCTKPMWLLQAFPYFYVPYGNDLPTEPAEGEEQVPGPSGMPPLLP